MSCTIRSAEVNRPTPTTGFRAHGRSPMPTAELRNVPPGHRPCRGWLVESDHLGARPNRDFPGVPVERSQSMVAKLNSSECVVLVDRGGHQSERRDVGIIPQACLHIRRYISARVDLTYLSENHGPPTLGLDTPHARHAGWISVAHPVAMRHLIEPIARSHRSDSNRFEKRVKSSVSVHIDHLGIRTASGSRRALSAVRVARQAWTVFSAPRAWKNAPRGPRPVLRASLPAASRGGGLPRLEYRDTIPRCTC